MGFLFGSTAAHAADADGDGVPAGVDCNDANAAINPGAQEVCDGKDVDEDCDGLSDDADTSVSEATKTTFYVDADADGFGGAGKTEDSCDRPAGYALKDDDCDDAAAHVHPGAPEQCDGTSNDCRGASRWTAASEDGTISARLADGKWVDLRTTFPTVAPATPLAPWVAPADATLHVCGGTFYGRTTVSAGALTVVGIGAARAHLAGGGAGPILEVSLGATALTVRGVTLSGGHADYGGAIRSRSKAAIAIEDAAFTSNSATAAGGAIYLARPASVTMKTSSFTGNTSDGSGGGIATAVEAVGGTLVLDGVTFRDNRAARMGGAADVTVVTVTAGSTFAGNHAQDAGGLACRTSGCEIRDTRFEGNVATGSGGGLYVAGKGADSMAIERVVFVGNVAGRGGGAFLTGATVSLSEGSFERNTGASGGALLVDTGKITVSGTTFNGNIGDGPTGGNGGALYQSSGNVVVEGSTFTKNEARLGAWGGDGGAIYAPGGALTLTTTTIEANRAGNSGGGLYVGQATVGATAVKVTGNTATRGAGVYQTGALSRITAADTTILDNAGLSAPTISAQGGGWYVSAGAQGVLMGGSRLSGNVVRTESVKDGVLGGGVAVFGSDSKFTCSDSAITANNAKGAAAQAVLGGGVYLGQGGASMSSAACEWGADATDNAPVDVWIDYETAPYGHAGSKASFTCTGDAKTCK